MQIAFRCFGADDPVTLAAIRLRAVDSAGPVRPDHGRRTWGREGYGLCDRALGAAYLQALCEAQSSPAFPGR